MTPFEWALALVVCGTIWLLICTAHADDERYARMRYSICSECNGDCMEGEQLCQSCRKVQRAAELRDKEKE